MPRIIAKLDASASLAYRSPVADLAYLNFFRNAADTPRNLVGSSASVVGAVTNPGGYAVTTGAVNYINTGVIDNTNDVTLITLCKAAALSGVVSTSQVFIGNYRADGAAGMGINLYVAGNVNSRTTGSYYDTANRKREIVSPKPSDAWAVRCIRVSATKAYVHDVLAGVVQEYDLTSARSLANANPIYLGWGGATFGGVSHIASAAIAKRCLTDAELADLTTTMVAVATADGLLI